MSKHFKHILTEKQLEIVNYKEDEMLIKGVPGSGKTLAILRRAAELAKNNPNDKIAIFTYSTTLTNAAQIIMRELNLTNVVIKTFHSWAMSAYAKVLNNGRRAELINTRYNDSLQNAINQVRKTNSHKLINTNEYKEFIQDEITWLKGKGITTWERYKTANRDGRGSGLNENYRKVIFDIYKAYETDKGHLFDFDDFGLLLSQNMTRITDAFKFDHMFIDEAQDLQEVQLKLLRVATRKTFTVAVDKGQKIYKTSFIWEDVGVNFRGGRSKSLADSFRSTKQIIQLANSLQLHDPMRGDKDFVPLILPKREGPKPVLCNCSSKDEQDRSIIKLIQQILETAPKSKIALLVKDWRRANSVKSTLGTAGLQCELLQRDSGNPHSSGIKITTYHSSKGLEFDFVIVLDLVEPNLKEDIDEEQFWELERRLLYVSMTRACTFLRMYTYGEPIRLIKEMDTAYYDMMTI